MDILNGALNLAGIIAFITKWYALGCTLIILLTYLVPDVGDKMIAWVRGKVFSADQLKQNVASISDQLAEIKASLKELKK
jgi:hypothetical protein